MTELNAKLQKLSEQCARKKKLEAELGDLHYQRKILQDKTYRLKNEMLSEQTDVDRLEGRSLYAFFYSVIGKKDEMLTKEKEEAYKARVKYDAAAAEREAVISDIDRYNEELKELRNCENEYQETLRQKAELLKSEGSRSAAEIMELEEQIRTLENLKREINEAISAGQRAKNITTSILDSLTKAKDWSTYDVIAGDGIISHVVKHNHLNTAQGEVEQLQIALRRFRTELIDVKIDADMRVNIDGFLGFADFFFDNIFTDWSVRNRISNSVDEVRGVSIKIINALSKLNSMRSDTDMQLAVLKTKHEEIVRKA